MAPKIEGGDEVLLQLDVTRADEPMTMISLRSSSSQAITASRAEDAL